MKPQHSQATDAKKEFRDACSALSTPAAFDTGKDYRLAMDRRTAAMHKLYNDGLLSDSVYQELMFHDDLTYIPESLR